MWNKSCGEQISPLPSFFFSVSLWADEAKKKWGEAPAHPPTPQTEMGRERRGHRAGEAHDGGRGLCPPRASLPGGDVGVHSGVKGIQEGIQGNRGTAAACRFQARIIFFSPPIYHFLAISEPLLHLLPFFFFSLNFVSHAGPSSIRKT